MPTDKDIEKALRDIGKQKADYPPDLKSATRAEFVNSVRTIKKGPGCPLFASTLIFSAIGLILVLGYAVGTVTLHIFELFVWMLSMSS